MQFSDLLFAEGGADQVEDFHVAVILLSTKFERNIFGFGIIDGGNDRFGKHAPVHRFEAGIALSEYRGDRGFDDGCDLGNETGAGSDHEGRFEDGPGQAGGFDIRFGSRFGGLVTGDSVLSGALGGDQQEVSGAGFLRGLQERFVQFGVDAFKGDAFALFLADDTD